MDKTLNVGVIGAGAISDIYLTNMTNKFTQTNVIGVAATTKERAMAKAEKYGIKAYSVEEMLKDDSIDLIVNLTPVGAHYDLIKKALLANKHVYTEKTMTETLEQAKELCAIANERHLYLGSAPETFMGTTIQTAKQAIKDDLIGDIHSFSISITRCNDLLTALFPFLRQPGAGALRDYLVYYITALVEVLGPVQRVFASIKTPYSSRVNTQPDTNGYNEVINTPNEAVIAATFEMESGVIGTIHEDNETIVEDRADFMIYGRKGCLKLGDANFFGNPVYLIKSEGYKVLDPIALDPVNPYQDNNRGIGPAEMVNAIAEHRENRTSKDLACHVLDIIEAMELSAKEGRMIDVKTTFTPSDVFKSL